MFPIDRTAGMTEVFGVFFTICSITISALGQSEAEVNSTNYFETFFVSNLEEDFSRNAVRQVTYKWPNAEVPYVFDDESYDLTDKHRVLAAMELISNETCVRFPAKTTSHTEHIKFHKTENCGSYIGFRRNRIEPMAVTYSEFCLGIPGAIQHELLHVLGLLHEQSRPDRDDYVQIVWENIEPQSVRNFMKADYETAETFGLPYDYDSLMHYPGNAFSKYPREVTMYAKINPARKLGQTDGPTFFDLEKIRRMYC